MSNIVKSLMRRDWFGGGSSSSKKQKAPSRSQSTDSLCMSLSRRRSSRAKSVESLDDIVAQYELCHSLIELSMATPAPTNQPQLQRTSSTRSASGSRHGGSRGIVSGSAMSVASVGAEGVKEAWVDDEQRNRQIMKIERRRRRRELEVERNDRLRNTENQAPRSRSRHHTPSTDSHGHTPSSGRNQTSLTPGSKPAPPVRHSVRGVGGLSERNARTAAGIVYATSSARSAGSGLPSKDTPSKPAPPHRSISAADLRETKMIAKATKVLHEHMKERTKPSNHPINNNQGSTPSGVPVKHSRPLFPVYSTTHNDPAAPPREIYDCNTSTDKQPVGVAAMKENLYYNANIETPPAPGSKGVNGCLNGIDTPLATQLLSIPGAQKIYDRSRDTTYVKGRLLGKGGFAKCYEMTDLITGKPYAGKIISKNRICRPQQRDKILREVEIHKNLVHKHVVRFYRFFEDNENMYIILELCNRKSLVNILKTRKSLTEPEVRYYLYQIIDGARYMHSQRVIHRDLKLGNMLINNNMHLKIADFGLATRLEYEGEIKLTVCGTPNYIAPEVLQKKGHSYQADIWAMGCITYALLVGRPPFETSSLKETYHRITSNKYAVPSRVSVVARGLIQRLLSANPVDRPTLDDILNDDFFQHGYLPRALPTSCCNTPFRVPHNSQGVVIPPQTGAATTPKVKASTHGSKQSSTPSNKHQSATSTSSDKQHHGATTPSNKHHQKVVPPTNHADYSGTPSSGYHHVDITANNEINSTPSVQSSRPVSQYITTPSSHYTNNRHNNYHTPPSGSHNSNIVNNNNYSNSVNHQGGSHSHHNYVNVPFSNGSISANDNAINGHPPSNTNGNITPPENYHSATENNNHAVTTPSSGSNSQYGSTPSIQRTNSADTPYELANHGSPPASGGPSVVASPAGPMVPTRPVSELVPTSVASYMNGDDGSSSAGRISQTTSTPSLFQDDQNQLPTGASNNKVQSRPKSYAAPLSPPDALSHISNAIASYKPPRNDAVQQLAHELEGLPSSVGGSQSSKVDHVSGSTDSKITTEGSSGMSIESLPNSSPLRLYQLLRGCLEQMPKDTNPSPERNVRPLWVTKWVDYSNKYGFGFQLSDKSVGVLFNDTTRMILSSTSGKIGYNDLSNRVYTFDSSHTPAEYKKKCQLLFYFSQYMVEHLIHGGDLHSKGQGAADKPSRSGEQDAVHNASCTIFMKKWFRTGRAIVMYLNNGTFQVNFFDDHTKVVLAPDGREDYFVTYINSRRQSVTYRLQQLKHFGCRREIAERLTYAHKMLQKVINVEEQAV